MAEVEVLIPGLPHPAVYRRAVFLIEPMGKPRVLSGEQSKKAENWRNYKRHLQHIASKVVMELPDGYYELVFYLPPPRSWSEKKREAAIGQPCKVKPDKDNLEKALLDALYENDSRFYDGRVTKLYGLPPRIEIFY